MIALAAHCLLFQLANGESVPLTADMLSVELVDDTPHLFDTEFVRHAANAVFHYFKFDLARQTVTVVEFAHALAKVLQGFSSSAKDRPLTSAPDPQILESDLGQLASESGGNCELFFFPRLREELRAQLRRGPRELHFRGLRSCVKHLAGAQRWTPRCQELEDRIVEFLRNCLTAEPGPEGCALLVK